VLANTILRSCRIKAEIVAQDEREQGLRATLNYGHSIGHALETLTGYGHYRHGEAVAVGMVTEANLAVLLGFLPSPVAARIACLVQQVNLPVTLPPSLTTDQMVSTLRHDKKNIEDRLTFVFPRNLGDVVVYCCQLKQEKLIEEGIGKIMEKKVFYP